MAIIEESGNLLESRAEGLVNSVNTMGVMGKGIALHFKKTYPEMFRAYSSACKKGEVKIGKMFVFRNRSLEGERIIINFPTKKDWRDPSRIEFIEQGLVDLVVVLGHLKLQSVAVPPLGCGLGGLDWDEVRPMIVEALSKVEGLEVHLYPPRTSPSMIVDPATAPVMTETKAVIIQVLKRYGILGYELTVLEVQKLLYFLQEAGQPLKLNFKEHIYGPYADNLRHLLEDIEGHYITGLTRGGASPHCYVKLLPAGIEKAEFVFANLDSKDTESRLSRVLDLIEGYESPYGMELLATVHWVAVKREEPARTVDEAVKMVHSWSTRKKDMKREHIEKAWARLSSKGWIGKSTP